MERRFHSIHTAEALALLPRTAIPHENAAALSHGKTFREEFIF